MVSRAGWVQQQRTGISFDELTSMVAELVVCHEAAAALETTRAASVIESSTEPQWATDWCSASGRTRVVRHGSSASLHSVLNQVPDAISAEYDVLFLDACVFSWCDYLWPHLNPSDAHRYPDGMVYMPDACLTELMNFHVQHNTAWLRRFHHQSCRESGLEQVKVRHPRIRSSTTASIQINKIGVMTQTN